MNVLQFTKEPGGRMAALIIGVLIALLPMYVWHDHTSGFLSDDGMYLMLADFFSPYHASNPFASALIIDQSRFPPAFPVLLALLGGGSEHMAIAHLVTAATFVLAAAMFYFWASRALESKELGAACLAIFVLLPRGFVYVLEIWSEFLYLAFLFAAWVLLERAMTSRRHPREWFCACALFVGLVLLTRTIGLALLAAFVLYLFLHRVKRKALYLSIAVLLPLCWKAIEIVNGYQGNYLEDLDQYLSLSGAEKLVVTQIPEHLLRLFQSWSTHFAVPPGSAWPWIAVTAWLLVMSLIGLVACARRKRIDPYYTVFYLAILVTWPYPDHYTRLLYPLIPVALVYLFQGLSVLSGWLVDRSGARRLANAGLVLLVLATIYPHALFVASRFAAPTGAQIPEDYRHTRWWLRGTDLEKVSQGIQIRAAVVRLLSRIDEYLAPYECTYAVHPVSTILYSHRRSVLLPVDATVDKLTRCDYLFVMNLTGKFGPDYPLELIDPDRLSLMALERDKRGAIQALLFRIRH